MAPVKSVEYALTAHLGNLVRRAMEIVVLVEPKLKDGVLNRNRNPANLELTCVMLT